MHLHRMCFHHLTKVRAGSKNMFLAVFPTNAKKVRICQNLSDGFAVKIQGCVKKSSGIR